MELEATNGRRVRATVVFSHALRFFRDTCVKELTDMAIADHPITATDIQWVITVPAIWRQSAKQFMRYAANEVLEHTYYRNTILPAHFLPHTQLLSCAHTQSITCSAHITLMYQLIPHKQEEHPHNS